MASVTLATDRNMENYVPLEAQLVQMNEEFYVLHMPIGRISSDLVQLIQYRVQRIQGLWVVFNALMYRDTIHSIYYNYRELKLAVEKSGNCKMIRTMNPNAVKSKIKPGQIRNLN